VGLGGTAAAAKGQGCGPRLSPAELRLAEASDYRLARPSRRWQALEAL